MLGADQESEAVLDETDTVKFVGGEGGTRACRLIEVDDDDDESVTVAVMLAGNPGCGPVPVFKTGVTA